MNIGKSKKARETMWEHDPKPFMRYDKFGFIIRDQGPRKVRVKRQKRNYTGRKG